MVDLKNTHLNIQLALIVITTSYICVQKNKNRQQIEAMLNEPAVCPFAPLTRKNETIYI
jgi:hypothetical protein